MNVSDTKLVPASVYYESLMQGIAHAKQRVIIHAMIISWGPKTKKIVPLLIKARQRGVDVGLVGDAYTRFESQMPKVVRAKLPPWPQTAAVNKQLREQDVHITYIGKIGLNPFKNRCHSKITIIDNTVYTFGGVNFADDALDNHDYMLEFTDKALADHLHQLVLKLEKNPRSPLPDTCETLNHENVMLYDGGKPGTSIIYETACEIVAQAKKVYLVSQMCPSGKLAELIAATENECYFIHPNQAEPYARIDLIWNAFRYGITSHYAGKRYLHAKFILAEGHDGCKHVLSGSNNFSWRGVAYGTKEIALHSTNPTLWQEFYNFLQIEVASP